VSGVVCCAVPRTGEVLETDQPEGVIEVGVAAHDVATFCAEARTGRGAAAAMTAANRIGFIARPSRRKSLIPLFDNAELLANRGR
jgi:hypothetical protein